MLPSHNSDYPTLKRPIVANVGGKMNKYQKMYENKTGDKESDTEISKNNYEIFDHSSWKDRYIKYLQELLEQSDNAEIKRLRNALEHYGQHDWRCLREMENGKQCTCGLNKALEE